MSGRADTVRASGSTADWALVAGLSVLSASVAAYEIVPASVSPLLMDRLGIGPVAVGLLVSAVLAGSAVSSLPMGALLARANTRWTVAGAALVHALVGLAGWAAIAGGSYGVLLATRAIAGGVMIVIWNVGAEVIGRAFEAEGRATALGIFTASGPAGFAAGHLTGPIVATEFGAGAIFVAYEVSALAGAGAVWVISGRYGSTSMSSPSTGGGELRSALTNRYVWGVCATSLLAYSLYMFVNSWMPTFLTEVRGVSIVRSGALVALFPAVGVLSRAGGGLVSDLVFGGRRRPVVMASFGVTGPLVVGLALVEGMAPIVVSLALAGFFVQLAIGLFYTAIHDLVRADVAAAAIPLLTTVSLVGAFGAPILAGWLIAATGSYFVTFACFGGVALAGVAVSRALPEPNRRAREPRGE